MNHYSPSDINSIIDSALEDNSTLIPYLDIWSPKITAVLHSLEHQTTEEALLTTDTITDTIQLLLKALKSEYGEWPVILSLSVVAYLEMAKLIKVKNACDLIDSTNNSAD